MADSTTRKNVRLAAVKYAEKSGLSVFPADISKPPIKKSYKSAEFSNGVAWGATNNPKQVQLDFWKFKADAIGFPTGKKNRFFVIDADTLKGHDVDGIANLTNLINGREWPKTRMAKSPSGSIHYYFRYPEQGRIPDSSGKIAPGVDVRGEGGMVIAPPSVTPDGGAYEWVKDIEVAPAPQWLLDELVVTTDSNHEHELGEPTAPFGKIADALLLLSNDENSRWQIVLDDGVVKEYVGWDGWNTIGMVVFIATGGSDEGFTIYDQWCSKHVIKYNSKEDTRDTWQRFKKNPPDRITVATLFAIVDDEHPGWQLIWNEENPVELALWNAEHPNENTDVDIDTNVILAAAALENLPPPTEWGYCDYIGKATHSATSGAVEGYQAWYRWSRRSPALDNGVVYILHGLGDRGHSEKTWLAYFKSPPNEIGLATLIELANQADPAWRDKLSEEFWQRVVSS